MAQEYMVPDDLLYTKEHEWVKMLSDQRVLVGVTDYAAKLLNDVVYVTLPTAGSSVKAMEPAGSLESIKAVSDFYSPLSGKIVKMNDKLAKQPELVNQSPYEDGWLVEIEPSDLKTEKSKLLSSTAYRTLIEEASKKK
jgi:glycine cleavage system H protein